MKLGVNIDHVATLRQARGTLYPDPVVAAMLAEYAGADSIVAHLREDRRHIQERDVFLIKEAVSIPFNLEMSAHKEVVSFALQLKPGQATLVPERRKELTTEGGLDVVVHAAKIKKVVDALQAEGIKVSLFIDPVKKQVKKAKEIGADIIEINTGKFSETKMPRAKTKELKKIKEAALYAKKSGFFVAAGHGIDYENVKNIVGIHEIGELNIGHSIVSRSMFVGIIPAVEEMLSFLGKKQEKTRRDAIIPEMNSKKVVRSS